MKKDSIISLLLLLVGFMPFVLGGGTIPNAKCIVREAGDPAGGDDCQNYSCYTDGFLYYCHEGVSYNKCGQLEGHTCTYLDLGTVGAGGPLCARKYRFTSMHNCSHHIGGSISQAFFSASPNCVVN